MRTPWRRRQDVVRAGQAGSGRSGFLAQGLRGPLSAVSQTDRRVDWLRPQRAGSDSRRPAGSFLPGIEWREGGAISVSWNFAEPFEVVPHLAWALSLAGPGSVGFPFLYHLPLATATGPDASCLHLGASVLRLGNVGKSGPWELGLCGPGRTDSFFPAPD